MLLITSLSTLDRTHNLKLKIHSVSMVCPPLMMILITLSTECITTMWVQLTMTSKIQITHMVKTKKHGYHMSKTSLHIQRYSTNIKRITRDMKKLSKDLRMSNHCKSKERVHSLVNCQRTCHPGKLNTIWSCPNIMVNSASETYFNIKPACMQPSKHHKHLELSLSFNYLK